MDFSEIERQIEIEIEQACHRIGNKLKTDAIKYIRDNDKIAWRTLVNSISYNIIQNDKAHYLIEFGSNAPHAKYVHEGREPGKMPPVNAIKEWLKTKGNRYFKSGFMGRTRANSTEASLNSLSWVIALKIKEKGIKAHPFLKVALDQNKNYIEKQLEKALTNIGNINAKS